MEYHGMKRKRQYLFIYKERINILYRRLLEEEEETDFLPLLSLILPD